MPIKYSQMTFLIIDDDDDDYFILKDLLTDAIGEGFKTVWAENYNSALQEIRSRQFDCYFLDNHLGAKLGLDLIDEIKNQFETAPPIIMLSGVDDHETDLMAMEKGADDYLIKSQLNSHMLERTLRYILKNKRLEEKLVKLAHFDSLTGLYNRSIFNELLNKMIEQSSRSNKKFALATIDLDNFKFINDNYGHPAGDVLLTKIAHRLKRVIRTSDVAARLGGDEFCLLLNNVNSDKDFIKLVENIIGVFKNPFKLDEKSIYTTPSIGIAIYPTDSRIGSELIAQSDRAMYQAKNSGRNTYSFYNHSLHKEAKIRHRIEVRLNRALLNNELQLYFQPIVSLSDKSTVSYEALLRWPNGNGSFHNTEEFINVAEESSLILRIGNWVFEQACTKLREWNKEGIEKRNLSINVSAYQFNTTEFTELVTKSLRETPGLSQQLSFELTERKPLKIAPYTIENLEVLSNSGCKFSVDDFGIGHSSISYLRAFPMNAIKIDKSIIQNILSSSEDLALCSAIIALGKALRLDVIAEGVETDEVEHTLIDLDCPFVQGYLYSRPMPAEDMPKH